MDLLAVDRFANDLRERIERGDYGNAGMIPSMSELMGMWSTRNRSTVAEAIMLLRVQGFLIQTPKKRFRVVHPRITLQGLTPNFRSYLEAQHLEVEEQDLETPRIEVMPLDVAKMFTRIDSNEPAIQQGIHVVHRKRKQGIVDVPLRIGHIWYPLDIAEKYLPAMQKDSSFDVPAALKREGIIIEIEDFTINGRVPDLDEMKELKIARYQPLLEVRRICYTSNRERVITLHRTIMDATRFEYQISREVSHWK